VRQRKQGLGEKFTNGAVKGPAPTLIKANRQRHSLDALKSLIKERIKGFHEVLEQQYQLLLNGTRSGLDD
jgi:hypothetical protein